MVTALSCELMYQARFLFGDVISGIPLSVFGKEICVTKYETHSGGSKPWSCMFQGYLTSYSEYTTKERAKMGRYGTKNGPAKAARHFSQLYMAILP